MVNAPEASLLTARPSAAVAIALLLAALAAAGCGLGAGEQVGEVELRVTRDFGAEPVLASLSDEIAESDTVMRVLDRNAELSTRFGGGFVAAIDGVSEAVEDGRRYDWFFYVNGVESPVGAADYPLHGGEVIWWDYRDWSGASRVPAVVGSWPHPFVEGYEGHRYPVTVVCLGGGPACAIARDRLEQAGIAEQPDPSGAAIELLVGPWSRVRAVPAAAQLEAAPQTSGVFADFTRRGARFELEGLNAAGASVRRFGPGTGLVAATRRYDDPPVWVITGTDIGGVQRAAALLGGAELRDRYAVAVEGSTTTPLPVP